MTNMISQFETSISAEDRHFLTDVRHLPPCRRHFTLIEMLVVIGIAGLLLTLMGPAFNRMTRGNDVESHASGLKLGMERASSLAASSRRYVAVLLPYGISATTSDAEEKAVYPYQRGGYRLAYLNKDDNDVFTFDKYVPESDWTNRGRDAYLVEVTEGGNNPTVTTTNTDLSASVTGNGYLKSATPSSGINCYAVVFSPFGDVWANSSETELKFHVTGPVYADRLVLRLNLLSGKVEFVAP